MQLDTFRDLQWRAKAFLVKQLGLEEDLSWIVSRVGNLALDRFLESPSRREGATSSMGTMSIPVNAIRAQPSAA
jgi:hypothetical protein